MSKDKRPSKKQLAVIDDLLNGQLDEQSVLTKHKVSRAVYSKWLSDDNFVGEFNCRIASAYRQSQALIARYSLAAAARLVHLTESEKEETARKACIDIISLPMLSVQKSEQPAERKTAGPLLIEQFSAETISKLLKVLAEEKI